MPADLDAQDGVAVILITENSPLNLSIQAAIVVFFLGRIHLLSRVICEYSSGKGNSQWPK